MKQRRVVCSACRYPNGYTLIGPRHFDPTMIKQMENYLQLNPDLVFQGGTEEQGFIDQFGVFMDRQEAFQVATAAGQILQKTGNPDSTELFSEDLY